jgi:GT2 family glycosyltransferase
MTTSHAQTLAEAVDSFAPTRVLEIELSQPLPTIAATDAASGVRYVRAHTLVRLHTMPVGLVMLSIPNAGLEADEVAAQIWAAISEPINAHLQADGLPAISTLAADGLPYTAEPACLAARQTFLKDAPPFMTVVVCTRDRAAQIPTALDSLLALEYPSYEIVLVDNAPSSEATADLVRVKYNTPKLRYIREALPGISRARNRGIREARGELIAFTDDDVRVDRYWLAEIARAFQSTPDVVCVSGFTMPAELDTEAQYYFEKFNSFTNGMTAFRHNAVSAPVNHPFYPINMAPFGACVNIAYRRSILHQVGGFRMTLGAGTAASNSEDIELYYRVTLQGHDMVYSTTALLWHYHRRNYDALQKQVYSYGVGQFPYLWYCIINQPAQLWNFIRRVPTVIRSIVSADAPRNQKKTGYYPADLIQRERRGMLYGPIAMLRSHWQAFRERPVVDLGTPHAKQD